ncbi:hypothetical protein GLU01_00640 [Nanohaloarchaea archaeon]|nr:hypothetical protein [Candidatus Nanohaloarchaea archaeon]
MDENQDTYVSFAEQARKLEAEKPRVSDAAIRINRGAQAVLTSSTALNLYLGHYGLAAVSAAAGFGSAGAERYLRTEEVQQQTPDPERRIGQLTREETEQIIPESEVVEYPYAAAEHDDYNAASDLPRDGRVLYDTEAETWLEFYMEDTKSIVNSAPCISAKVEGDPDDILDGGTELESIKLGELV